MSRPSYGPDLDNLLNPIMEGLKKTVLRNDPEGDAAIVSIIAKKHIAASNQLIGAKIILKRVETW